MQQAQFGDRQSPGGGDASALDAEEAPHLPVQIERQLGVPAVALLVPFAIAAGLQLLPLVASGLPLKDGLLHTSTGLILGFLGAALALIFFATRARGVLDIDDMGLKVRKRNKKYFYNWSDIDRFDEVKNGVKISLKGRSAEQNQYNIVPSRFAKSSGALRELLSAGQLRHSERSRIGPATTAPGDDLRRARIRSSMLLMLGMTVPPIAIFGILFVWQAAECLKSLDLQTRGLRTYATVTRIYTSGCGRSSCNISAEFSYASARDGRRHTGRGLLANDRNHDDPDLAYARAYGRAPVVYDPNRPQVVDLNFNDVVFRHDPVKIFATLMEFLGGIVGFITVVLALAVLPALVQAFRTPKNLAPYAASGGSAVSGG